jgi:hypothetical protein
MFKFLNNVKNWTSIANLRRRLMLNNMFRLFYRIRTKKSKNLRKTTRSSSWMRIMKKNKRHQPRNKKIVPRKESEMVRNLILLKLWKNFIMKKKSLRVHSHLKSTWSNLLIIHMREDSKNLMELKETAKKELKRLK